MLKLLNLITVLLFLLVINCSQEDVIKAEGTLQIDPAGSTITTRILPPPGFKRAEYSTTSFEYYLANLELKPHGSRVRYYNGEYKQKSWVHAAVINMDTGTRDLQQCADAFMRLRGEYLYWTKQYEKIHFNFTNGFRADYTKWMNGYRISVYGNNTRWIKSAKSSVEYYSFRNYLDMVFSYAGTLSLSKEMKHVSIESIRPGDVFIRGGSPGHAVIVVDLVMKGQKKLFLLAQSYMPAQEIHILVNPGNKSISPWYSADFEGDLVTPEWIFKKTELKRLADNN